MISFTVCGSPQTDAVRVFAQDSTTQAEAVGSASIKNDAGTIPLISMVSVDSAYQKRGIGLKALKEAVNRYPAGQEFRYVAATAGGAALIAALRRNVPAIKLTEID